MHHVIAYHVLGRWRDYEDLGEAYFDQHDRAAVKRRLVRRLEALGYAVQLEPRVA
jgi:transposase